MNIHHQFRCPETLAPLSLEITKQEGDEVIEGFLVSEKGTRYPIVEGLPYLLYPAELPKEEQDIIGWYERNYASYDAFLPLTFQTFGVDEQHERLRMIEQLDIQPHHKVLETGAGTGRDSVLIAQRLGKEGELHVHDIFDKILKLSYEKLNEVEVPVTYTISNAIYLPYPDNYFDVYYHFGGFNTFSDKKRAFAEISRVVKPGGKVIVGDESMPAWLRERDFGKVLINSNPHYNYELPLAYMHESARNVKVEYIIGGVFYYIYYTVGEGDPYADFDFEIPGPRGGTHRTRYYGHLEGVSQEAIELASKAFAKSGKSMHRWLDDVIKNAAKTELE